MEIRHGNVLLIPCQGNGHCGGLIRVPFTPTLDGAPEPKPATTRDGGECVWTRVSGTTAEDITLSPSVDADECGHFHVVNGKVQ